MNRQKNPLLDFGFFSIEKREIHYLLLFEDRTWVYYPDSRMPFGFTHECAMKAAGAKR